MAADVEDVEPAEALRVRARVVEDDAQRPRVGEQAVVLLAVQDPALDLPGADRHVVDVDERVVREPPAQVVDLADRPASSACVGGRRTGRPRSSSWSGSPSAVTDGRPSARARGLRPADRRHGGRTQRARRSRRRRRSGRRSASRSAARPAPTGGSPPQPSGSRGGAPVELLVEPRSRERRSQSASAAARSSSGSSPRAGREGRYVSRSPSTARSPGRSSHCRHMWWSVGIPAGVVRQPNGSRRYASSVCATPVRPTEPTRAAPPPGTRAARSSRGRTRAPVDEDRAETGARVGVLEQAAHRGRVVRQEQVVVGEVADDPPLGLLEHPVPVRLAVPRPLGEVEEADPRSSA